MKVYSIHVHVHVYVNFEIKFAENIKKKSALFLGCNQEYNDTHLT